ncbi:hypothetical protein MBANPS3_001674 [Mucor bainieri]
MKSLRQSMESQQQSMESQRQSMNHEIEHLKGQVAFYRAANNEEELNVEIEELKSQRARQDGTIQELTGTNAELKERNSQLEAKISELASQLAPSGSSRETEAFIDQLYVMIEGLEARNSQLTLEANESADLLSRAKDSAHLFKVESKNIDLTHEVKMLTAKNDSQTKEIQELQAKCRRLHEQVGSTAKPTLKSKTVYQRKPNLTQRSLNTMFHDQESSSAASSPASTQSAPSPIASTTSTRHTTSTATASTTASAITGAPDNNPISIPLKRPLSTSLSYKTTATASTTASAITDAPDNNPISIPLKRHLSTSLSDKTNSVAPVLIRDNKEKGRAVEVKHEQLDVDISTAIENMPDQAIRRVKRVAILREKPKSNTAITNASTSTVRRVPQPTSAPTTPASFATCNASHRRDRSNMIGGTCTACVNFYGTETIAANIDGQQLELTGRDRIQQNSRHRQHHNQRAKTPPGFWDLDFQTPEGPFKL